MPERRKRTNELCKLEADKHLRAIQDLASHLTLEDQETFFAGLAAQLTHQSEVVSRFIPRKEPSRALPPMVSDRKAS